MSPGYDAIQEAVRLDPESIWDRLRDFLCSQEDPDMERVDLVEDLRFGHADAFIERLEALVVECPASGIHVASAHVGGLAMNFGLERFDALQDRLARQ